MPWNTPTDVSTGDNLTSTLWNNLLGTNGSLKFLYDQLTRRNVVLFKSTDTVFGGAGNSNIVFDTIVTKYTNQQLNFPVTVPITEIPLPSEGMYIVTYQFRATASVTVRSNVIVTTGAVTSQYTDTVVTNTNILNTHTVMFFAPATSSTVRLNTQVSAAVTITSISPTLFPDSSQVFSIARI